MKILVFHHNDMDGRSAAAIIRTHPDYKDAEFTFIEVDYSKRVVSLTPLQNPADFDETFIVDLSLNADTINMFKDVVTASDKVTWIDHHKTSLDLSKGDSVLLGVPGIRNMKYSGALLTYLYLYGDCKSSEEVNQLTETGIIELVPEWIRYVDDYDTWKYKMGDGTTWFKYGFDSIDSDPRSTVYHSLMTEILTPHQLITKGSVIYEYLLHDFKESRDSIGYEADFEGHKVYVMNKEGNSLMFGDKIHNHDFVVRWTFNGSTYQYSLYTEKDIDLTEIAKKYGGGGHPRACGFSSETKVV